MSVVVGHRALVNIPVEVLDFSFSGLLVVLPVSAVFGLVGVVVSAVAVSVELLELSFVVVSVTVSQMALQELVHHPNALESLTVLEFQYSFPVFFVVLPLSDVLPL